MKRGSKRKGHKDPAIGIPVKTASDPAEKTFLDKAKD